MTARLVSEVLEPMKRDFVGKDEVIDLLGVSLVAGENLFILGPPGTAKSALVHNLSARLEGRTFDYLLTRFTEPNELFGPFDIRRLREGDRGVHLRHFNRSAGRRHRGQSNMRSGMRPNMRASRASMARLWPYPWKRYRRPVRLDWTLSVPCPRNLAQRVPLGVWGEPRPLRAGATFGRGGGMPAALGWPKGMG